jgi:anti-anti-sigma factor
MDTDVGSLAGFGVEATFAKDRATLAVRGDVDILTASAFGGFIDAALASGYATVALDLADVDFMGAVGLTVIASAADRLTAAGGQLTIRSPSAMTARMLNITGLANRLRMETVRPGHQTLGAEEKTAAFGTSGIARTSTAARNPRQLSTLPADDDVVTGVLRLVVALASATVGGADGVSVSLRRHGRLATVAASDETISEMDADQYATGEGPCVDASLKGHWFHVESLDSELRWPAFTPRAKQLGINSILSTPLLARDQPIGALNIYSRTRAVFTPKDQELAAVFAAEASAILTDSGVGLPDSEMATRLQQALRTREVIALAQGVVMERDGVGQNDAFTILRRASQASDRPLRERAETVVASARRSEPNLATG